MAGLYGHERANRGTSEAIYALSWAPILGDPQRAGRTLATGYSCRCQAKLMEGKHLMHPLQVLLQAVTAQPSVDRAIAEGRTLERHEEY